MVRKPASSSGWSPKQKGLQEQPAPRKLHFEQSLCDAIAKRVVVELKYDGEFGARRIAPHAVYRSSAEKVNLSGYQLSNANEPLARDVPRTFEVGKITDMSLTTTKFIPDVRFDRFDTKYQNGLLCSV
ncbi:hypothetical protein QO058_24910 [Bosea vestrisii]|uniref:hypothetical protein n=1 Tax=Bosea vestrisii TaxID=151416 RepID=UPI0024DF7317|nr:hypothetical protein [Bosea vestrisii]WID95949.1 hypothetical protein QO058_24910 [Bosea vestrisii]